jgi:HEAT repeat protein
MDNIKQRMSDANKAVLKAYVQLICLVVEALGANAKQFSKKILPPMLQSLADKQSLVRADVVTAMDKWAEHCGAELIISIGGPMVSQENPELRTEMLGWILKNKDSIKLCPADALKEIIKPLVECLSDKTPAIRNLAEETISYIMPLTGYPAF